LLAVERSQPAGAHCVPVDFIYARRLNYRAVLQTESAVFAVVENLLALDALRLGAGRTKLVERRRISFK